MRILLTGRDGQVGWELSRALAGHDVVATGHRDLDLADMDAIRVTFRAVRPDVVINAAAYTAVDRAEAQAEPAMTINGVAPGILAEEAKRAGALLVHFSTDYVFDGENPLPYSEHDEPRPINAYGRSKLQGEKAVMAAGCRVLVLRTSWVYGPRGRNFFATIAAKAKAGGDLRVVSDQRGVPTESRFIAECTCRLMAGGHEGLLHLVPSGSTTWHGFATTIVERLALPAKVIPVTAAEYPTAARRPANSVLDNSAAIALLGTLPSWETLLERCVQAWTSS